ncbi:MAG: hypothetical protein ABJA94_08755 [Rhodoglobus sp.]
MTLDSLEMLMPAVARAVKEKPNVVGFGIGYKRVKGQRTSQLGFTVFVSRKLFVGGDHAVPAFVEGVPTDVVESGQFVPGANVGPFRPIPGGVLISPIRGAGGTLGCYLRCEAYGGVFMLSNNHVLARYGNVRAGSFVQQGDITTVARVFRYPILGDLSDVDCAVAQMVHITGDGNSPDAQSVLIDYLGAPNLVPGWVGEDSVDVAIAHANLTGGVSTDDVIAFHVDAPAGENMGYLRVLPALGGSSPVEAIGGWFGTDTQAAGLAVLDIDGDSSMDAVVFFIDHQPEGNRGYYRIGHELRANGKCTTWDEPVAIGGSWGTQTAGGGIAVVDLSGNGKPDLITFFVDAPHGENAGYLRIGHDFDAATGLASWINDAIALPGPWGDDTQGADITWLGRDAGGLHIFLLMHIDNPPGENSAWYRTVLIDATGNYVSSDGPHRAVGWFGSDSQGLGVSATLTAFGTEVTVAAIDAPPGANSMSLRRADALPGAPRRLGAPLTGATPSYLGQHVWKSGQRTEVSDGEVVAISASILVTPGGAYARYWTVQNIIAEPCITNGGDSGSAFVDGHGRVAALYHSGTTDASTMFSAASRIDLVLERLRLSSPYAVGGWVGSESMGGSIAAVRWPVSTDLVVVHIDQTPAGGVGYFRVGFAIDTNGQVTGTQPWTRPATIGNWKSQSSQSVGVAVATLPGSSKPCVVVLRLDHFGNRNEAWLHIGRDLDHTGAVAGGWTVVPVDSWRDGNCQGLDIAVADLGTGKPDLIVLHVDNLAGENVGWYRVGRGLSADGTVQEWRDWLPVPGWWGTETSGAGIAVTQLDNDARPEIIVFHVDNAPGANMGFYRIGFNVDANGLATHWSAPVSFGGSWGTETQGAGLTVADITGSKRPDLICLNVDNPTGENTAFYRLLYDIMPSGQPAVWSVAT